MNLKKQEDQGGKTQERDASLGLYTYTHLMLVVGNPNLHKVWPRALEGMIYYYCYHSNDHF
jgi:hypothetical protein